MVTGMLIKWGTGGSRVSTRMNSLFALGANFYAEFLTTQINGLFLQVWLAMFGCTARNLAPCNAYLIAS